jgi:hypothetical protein
MRRLLTVVFRVLPWLLLLLVALYFTVGEGWKDAIRGRFHRKAHEMFSDVRGITEARIYLLMGKKEQETQEVFPIRPYGTNSPVCGSATLTGEKLDAFLRLWSYQSPSEMRQGLCHDPAYGFRLYRGSRLMAETSVCWHCNNYYVEVWPLGSGWYGFEADSKFAIELLNLCDSLLPYDRSKNTGTEKNRE